MANKISKCFIGVLLCLLMIAICNTAIAESIECTPQFDTLGTPLINDINIISPESARLNTVQMAAMMATLAMWQSDVTAFHTSSNFETIAGKVGPSCFSFQGQDVELQIRPLRLLAPNHFVYLARFTGALAGSVLPSDYQIEVKVDPEKMPDEDAIEIRIHSDDPLSRKKREAELVDFLKKSVPPFRDETDLLFEDFARVKRFVKGEFFMPGTVQIHTTNRCNLNCGFCHKFTELKSPKRPANLSKETLIGLIDQLTEINSRATDPADRVDRIFFAEINGETLVNAYSAEVFNYAIGKGFKLGLITNGVLLNEQVRTAIVNGEDIWISVNASTKETWSAITQSDKRNFATIIENVKELVKLKKESGSQLSICLAFVVVPENISEIESFAALAHELGVDSIRYRRPIDDAEALLTEIDVIRAKATVARLSRKYPDMQIVFIDEIEQMTHNIDRQKCYIHQFRITLGSDGMLYPCTYVAAEPKFAIGNLAQQHFKSVWRSVNMTKKMEELNPSESCPDCSPSASRLNPFLTYLRKEYERDPGFLKWLEGWVAEKSDEYGYKRTASAGPESHTELGEQEEAGKIAIKMLAQRMLEKNRDWILTPEIFCDSGEAARDEVKYWYAFNHRRIFKNDLNGFVKDVIDFVDVKGLKDRAVALVPYDPRSSEKDELPRQLKLLQNKGIRFIPVDIETLREFKSPSNDLYREGLRDTAYATLLLVRGITELDASSPIYRALRWLTSTHFDLTGIGADDLIKAIVEGTENSIAIIINAHLAFRPSQRFENLHDYYRVPKEMLCA